MVSKEWIEKMKGKLSTKSGGNQYCYMPKESGNKIVVRILPPIGEDGFAQLFYKHYSLPEIEIKDEEGKVKYKTNSLACLANWDKVCPICNVVEQHKDIDSIKRMKQTKRFYYNVKIIKHPEQDFDPDTVYIMISPETVFREILKYFYDEELFTPDLLDPQKGYNIVIEKLPDNKYKVEATRNPSPIDNWEKLEPQIRKLSSFVPEFKPEMITMAEEVAKKIENTINRISKDITKLSSLPEQQEEQKPELPECYGAYEGEESSKCMVCPHEINCISASNKEG